MADGEHGEEARAKFHAMTESTQEDWAIIAGASAQYGRELPEQIVSHLNLLKGDCGGFVVDRLEHSLQTATRAFRDGRDEEYVVCALLHDIGDNLAPFNHPDIAAGILKPVVSEKNHWMVQHHGIFQGYYFWHYIGLDRNTRDRYADSPHYGYTEEFCALYDSPAFDSEYESFDLAHFEPLIHDFFKPKGR